MRQYRLQENYSQRYYWSSGRETIQLTVGDVKHLTDAVNGSLIDTSAWKMGSHSYVEPAWVSNDKNRTTDLSFDNSSQWFIADSSNHLGK